ncbi:UNVERIFIED_CONTAM: hypothetical protein Slati_1452900 [Sesamum latifolium]|uniref:Uncharacterized protein n=1 Tax=Sesamum latifolium TaxID=2727402 RepID=A0AAW2X9X3_9LAMI
MEEKWRRTEAAVLYGDEGAGGKGGGVGPTGKELVCCPRQTRVESASWRNGRREMSATARASTAERGVVIVDR